jgi:hypothetical protein
MPEASHTSMTRLFYKGDAVRIKPFEEIAATLDEAGCLDSLPFMPEMRAFCGRTFTVACRLEKTCVEGYGARSIPDTLILEGVRCDGSGHDGCQRACTMLWKEAWIEPAKDQGTMAQVVGFNSKEAGSWPFKIGDGEGRYFCQSTQLQSASSYLFPLSFKRCLVEYTSKNIELKTALRYLWTPMVVKVKSKIMGRAAVQPVGTSRQTPTESLGLQPGDWVEVKSAEEIGATLDGAGFNRGLEFTPQMLPFCGGRFRVRSRVDRAILETTGRMKALKDTVILERATCDGHTILGGCSRDVYHYWREIWLRRAPAPGAEVP